MTLVKKQILIIAAGLIVAATLFALNATRVEAAKNGYEHQKVVYHLNDIEHAKAAFRNIRNHLNAVGDDNVDIIVVTHSGGALALVDGESDSRGNTFEGDIAALANRGVKFQICNNTIKGKGIDRNKINLNAEVVPSGVAQLAHLEQQGYVYVKP
jgi:intracellular sulfur oxidation DsrE/DsrF family protein